ncbi:hypothetical protein [Aquibium microcysteis]|uniref:DUF7940 domain-containing protein n=1 Tax=Aquibium microcysteis TaxID=675281 RepID=UPI00165D1595|nr:hypothetical protein [Aquibium microcysteis]
MRLHQQWRDILWKAWSIRLMALAAVLSGLEVALPFLDGLLSVGTGTFAALSCVTTAGAFIARIVAQRGLSE